MLYIIIIIMLLYSALYIYINDTHTKIYYYYLFLMNIYAKNYYFTCYYIKIFINKKQLFFLNDTKLHTLMKFIIKIYKDI